MISSEKLALLAKLHLYKSDKSSIFNHSFLDNPQSYAYLKLSREAQRTGLDLGEVARSGLGAELLPQTLNSQPVWAWKLGIKFNKQLTEEATSGISNCISSHVSS